MKHIVIVGAGPIGLFLAILLTQLGIKVVVIDPRADAYTRPGHLTKAVFDELTKQINKWNKGDEEKISPSTSFHIKDVERELYNVASKLKIEIRKEEFKGFEKKGVKTNEGIIACDLAFDATGSIRALVREVNQLLPAQTPFKIKSVANNPNKHHFLAYVQMSKEDFESLPNDTESLSLAKKKNAVKYITLLEKLINQYGWNEFVFPFFHYFKLQKNKLCIYFETPPPEFKHSEEMLTDLLQFHADKSDLKFHRKIDHKPRFQSFKVDPVKVDTSLVDSTEVTPMVIPIGDAQIDSDYRMGMGIKSGMERVNALLESMVIENGEIKSIDKNKYEARVNPLLEQHENKIVFYYQRRWTDKANDLARLKQTYLSAIDECKSDVDKKHFQLSLEKLVNNLPALEFNLGIDIYNSALDGSGNIKLDRNNSIMYLSTVKEGVGLIVKALTKMPPEKSEHKTQIKAALISVTAEYRNTAMYLFGHKNFDEAEELLKSALILFMAHLSDQLYDIVDINFNLLVIQNAAGKYGDALNSANRALHVLEKIDVENKKAIHAHINYHLALSMLNIIKKSDAPRDKLLELYDKVKKIAVEISQGGNISKELIEVLNNNLIGIKELLDRKIAAAKVAEPEVAEAAAAKPLSLRI